MFENSRLNAPVFKDIRQHLSAHACHALKMTSDANGTFSSVLSTLEDTHTYVEEISYLDGLIAENTPKSVCACVDAMRATPEENVKFLRCT